MANVVQRMSMKQDKRGGNNGNSNNNNSNNASNATTGPNSNASSRTHSQQASNILSSDNSKLLTNSERITMMEFTSPMSRHVTDSNTMSIFTPTALRKIKSQSSMRGSPKHGKYAREHFNIIGGVGRLNLGISCFEWCWL